MVKLYNVEIKVTQTYNTDLYAQNEEEAKELARTLFLQKKLERKTYEIECIPTKKEINSIIYYEAPRMIKRKGNTIENPLILKYTHTQCDGQNVYSGSDEKPYFDTFGKPIETYKEGLRSTLRDGDKITNIIFLPYRLDSGDETVLG